MACISSPNRSNEAKPQISVLGFTGYQAMPILWRYVISHIRTIVQVTRWDLALIAWYVAMSSGRPMSVWSNEAKPQISVLGFTGYQAMPILWRYGLISMILLRANAGHYLNDLIRDTRRRHLPMRN
jgi:hypothetical protein